MGGKICKRRNYLLEMLGSRYMEILFIISTRVFTSIYFNLFCNYYFSMDIYLSTILISRMENKIFYDFVEIDVYTIFIQYTKFYIIGYFCGDKLIETYLVILFFFLGYRFKWNTICCLSSSSLKVCGGGE